MRALLVEHQPDREWEPDLGRLVADLSANAGWVVGRTGPDEWLRGEAAEAYLLCCGKDEDYEPLLASCRTIDPARLHRTLLLGTGLDWVFATYDHASGTLPHVLETYDLAGALRSRVLTKWQEAPSYFAGPKGLMTAMQTNCMKVAQSQRYCFWFAARGKTLGAFLTSYLPVLDQHLRSAAT